MAKGKKYTDALKKFDRDNLHAPQDALQLAKSFATAKFDETVELALLLGIDSRKQDQVIRTSVVLPAGTGRQVRIAVFASGETAAAAREANADLVGAEDLVEQIQNGMLDFDVVVATPDLMPLVGRLGKVLGPRNLMPNPKAGTVTTDVVKAVNEIKGGRIELSASQKSHGVINVGIGKASFDVDMLLANFRAVIEEVQRNKPAAAKGRFFKKVSISTTMGPSIKVDTARLRLQEDAAASA